jgi:hypothetical protein
MRDEKEDDQRVRCGELGTLCSCTDNEVAVEFRKYGN